MSHPSPSGVTYTVIDVAPNGQQVGFWAAPVTQNPSAHLAVAGQGGALAQQTTLLPPEAAYVGTAFVMSAGEEFHFWFAPMIQNQSVQQAALVPPPAATGPFIPAATAIAPPPPPPATAHPPVVMPNKHAPIRPTVIGGNILMIPRNPNFPNKAQWVTALSRPAGVPAFMQAPGKACTQAGCNCGHHPWPTSGVLLLHKCNIVCEVCGLFSGDFGESIGNLHRHVRQVHLQASTKNQDKPPVPDARLYTGVQLH